MNIFLDTNIVLDFLIKREPFFDNANKIVQVGLQTKNNLFVAAHSILNIDYIIRKLYSATERKQILKLALLLFQIVGVDNQKLINALDNNSFYDFEDSVQNECAKQINADYIITRNKKDFIGSIITVLEPNEFLELL